MPNRHVTLQRSVLLLAVTLALPAFALEPRHLNPAVAGQLETAISQGGVLELQDGHVDVGTARLKVCQGTTTCADLTLGDVEPDCPGAKAGAWCVHYAGPTPPFAAELEKRLAAMPATSVWQTTVAKKPTPIPPAPSVHASPWTWPLALAALLLPIALGWLIGRLARKRRKARVWALLVAVAIIATGGLMLDFLPVLGLWDFLFAAGLLSATALRTAEQPTAAPARRRVALALILALVLAEVTARLLSPAPLPPAPDPESLLLPADLEHAVGLTLDPTSVCEELFEAPTATEDPPHGKRVVLILGDEAIAGRALLQQFRMHKELQLGADVTSVDRTVLDTSLDAQYLLAAKEIPRLHPAMIVLFPNDANDFAELGRVRACCGNLPLLDLAMEPTPAVLCEADAQAVFPDEMTAWALLSPWPWPARVVASQSSALHVLLSQLDAARLRVAGIQPQDAATRQAQYLKLLQQLQALTAAQHVKLVVVGLPIRGQENAPRGKDSPLGLARAAGLDVLDASERFADALRDHEPLYLHADPSDGQLGGVGHHLLANWLSPQLAERLLKK
jgi:hypothetical protein